MFCTYRKGPGFGNHTQQSHIDIIGAYVFGIVWNAMNSECGVAGTGKSDANVINAI